MALVPFADWWHRVENQQGFWRVTETGVAVSLDETPRYIFRQILQLLKGYHDRNVGYGNLLEGVLIDENKQVHLYGYYGPNPKKSFAAIKQNFLDFEELVAWVEDLITLVKRVQPACSSRKFHDLCRLLDFDYYNSVDRLRRFGFYVRNNPLFLDEAAKFLFFRKVLTIKEFNYNDFSTSVRLPEIRGWSEDVRHDRLQAVKDHDQNRNHFTYSQPDGSIVFYRNCLGHVRSRTARYDDAKILQVLEDDLPKVIPVWFYDLVRELDSNIQKCTEMCDGYGWREFLSTQPTVFN